MKTDIEIARNTPLVNIEQIAKQAGIPAESVNPYGRYMAKIDEHLIDDAKVKESNLILVTAITPTKANIHNNFFFMCFSLLPAVCDFPLKQLFRILILPCFLRFGKI